MAKKYYQNPKYKRVYGDSLVTPEGRFAFVALDKPRQPPAPKEGEEPSKPRYEVTWLTDERTNQEELSSFLDELSEMVQGMLVQFNAGAKTKISVEEFLSDGNEMDLEKYPFYADKLFIQARNGYPQRAEGEDIGWYVLNAKKKRIDPADVKGGQLGRLVITPHVGPTGLSFRIERVQLILDDGTRFGGGAFNHDKLLNAIGGEEDEESEEEVQDIPEVKTVEEATEEVIQEEKTPAAIPEPVKAPVGQLSPKQIQDNLKRRAAEAVAKQNAEQVSGAAPKTGRGKKAAIDNL